VGVSPADLILKLIIQFDLPVEYRQHFEGGDGLEDGAHIFFTRRHEGAKE
jgi:hypothetical protein